MRRYNHPFISWFWPLVLFVIVGLLAACGGGEEPPALVIPTVAATAAAPTTEPTAVSELPTAAATILATATLPPPPTVAPPLPTGDAPATVAPTTPPTVEPTIAPTAEPMATPTPAQTGGSGYRVAFVAANDMLNVRRRPNADAAVVTQLPPGATGIQVIDQGQAAQGDSRWLPVTTSAGDGWVNSRFLTEDVSREAFCADPAVTELLSRLQTAIAERDGRALAELVHPDRGLRLRLTWWNEEVVIRGNNEVRQLFRADERHNWGTNEGSGEAIRGPFNEVMLPLLERDLLAASQWACDEGLFGGTAGMTILPEGYEAVRYYSAHRPAPAEQELDWGTWLIGIERWEGQYYLSYLVHYRWEI
jgi:hypothetical protein